jgi:hypothetical protein
VTICIWGLKPWKNLWMWNLNKNHMNNQYIHMNIYAKITQTDLLDLSHNPLVGLIT